MSYVNDVYFDFAMSVKRRLNEEINARIVFEIYEDIDTIIFNIYFKGFEFKYAINDIQTIVYTGRTDEVVTDMLSAYKGCILNSFFKSKARKERDQTKRIMGVI